MLRGDAGGGGVTELLTSLKISDTLVASSASLRATTGLWAGDGDTAGPQCGLSAPLVGVVWATGPRSLADGRLPCWVSWSGWGAELVCDPGLMLWALVRFGSGTCRA